MNLPNDLNKNFVYTPERKDKWRVMKPDVQGKYRGDCEDYALTALYLLKDRTYTGMLFSLVFGRARIIYCETAMLEPHAVLKIGDLYLDNLYKKFMTKEQMLEIGYTFPYELKFYRWYHVLQKLL
jgi:predicted transglutaminase-like cysteine proteinase